MERHSMASFENRMWFTGDQSPCPAMSHQRAMLRFSSHQAASCVVLMFFSALALSEPPPAQCLTVVPAPLETLVTEADVVIHGHVIDRQYEEAMGHPGLVQTRLTIWAWDVVKPAPIPLPGISVQRDGQVLVEIVMPGGTINGTVTVFPGVPEFHLGDEIVTLLTLTPLGLSPIGYSLGSWRVSHQGTMIPIAQSPSEASTTYGTPLRTFTDHLRTLLSPSRPAP
jgi:hypothetical protein